MWRLVGLALSRLSHVALALSTGRRFRRGLDGLDVVGGRDAQHEPAEDLTQDIAERHGAAGHE